MGIASWNIIEICRFQITSPGTATMQNEREATTIRRVTEGSGRVNVTSFFKIGTDVADGVHIVRCRGVVGDAEIELCGSCVVMQ